MFTRIWEILALTTTERKVLLFLACALLVGAGIRLYQYSIPSATKFDYHSSDSTFAALSSVQEDSTERPSPAIVKGKLNINIATQDQLIELPGIGEKTAARIIELRTSQGKISSLDELRKIKGITKRKLEQLQTMVVIE